MTAATPPPAGGAYAAPPSADPTAHSHARAEHGIDVSEVSVGELIGNVTRDLSTLMRQELALAQAELKQEATKTAKGAGLLGGAGFAAFFVVLFLSLALWAGLSNVMDAGWAGLIVAVLWAIVAGVLFVIGRQRLQQVHPKPERTVDTLSNVPDALKGNRGGSA
jgi:hypothetical protein